MTNTEKFILKEKDAKEAVTALLKIFDGKSYKFANAALNTAKNFLNEDSQFKADSALKKIEQLIDAKVETSPKKNSN